MPKLIETAPVHAARRANGLVKWVDGQDTMATAVALTDAGIYYNIPVGKQVLITKLLGDLDTVSDDVAFYLAQFGGLAATGARAQLHGELHIHTGTAMVTHGVIQVEFNPPILVVYSASVAKSISIYADANDDGAEANFMWLGWVEPLT